MGATGSKEGDANDTKSMGEEASAAEALPFKRLQIKPKNKHLGQARGTTQASEMVEIMIDNWDQLQDKFNSQTESEKEEMMDHFNCSIDNLGDTLFGDDANPDDFKKLIKGLEDD